MLTESAGRFGGLFFGAVVACWVGGCAAPTTGQRAASLARNGVSPTTLPTIDRRVGLVLTAHGLAAEVSVTDVVGKTATAQVDFVPSHAEGARFGTAAAVDRRGYFLTAAHVVGSDPIWVLMPGLLYRPARVVFRGDGHFDVAILSVDMAISETLEWADRGRIKPGTLLLECGPTDPLKSLGLQVFAGRCRTLENDTADECGYEVLGTSLPMRHGDSGGPVMTVDGKLAGVAVYINLLTGRTYALRPDPAWVRAVIDRDFLANKITGRAVRAK